MSRVIDYASGRPSTVALRAAGAIAVCRYLAFDNFLTHGKLLTPVEAAVLTTAGIAIVSNWEQAGSWAEYSQGFAKGEEHATEAARQHIACGGPPGRPIYFSVDFDATDAQLPTVADYYRGVASVIGHDRTGAYGGYRTIRYLLDHGVIRWAWQTFAWSGSPTVWDSRAHLRQIQNDVTIDGVSCDLNDSMTADFGQWGTGDIEMSQPFAGDNADAHGWALTQRVKEYQVHAGGNAPGLTTVPNKVESLFVKLDQFLGDPSAPVLTDAQVTAIANQVVAKLNPQLAAIQSEIHQLRTQLATAAQHTAVDLAVSPAPSGSGV